MGVKVTLGFPGGSLVKNPPASVGDAGDLGSSLGGEDLLEEKMATHSSILAWETPRTEEPGRLQSMGSQSRTQLGNSTTHSRGTLQRLRVRTGGGGRWQSVQGGDGGCSLTSTASALFESVPLKLPAWGCFSSWEEERERGLKRNGLLQP